jgi:hypothetical protein
MKSARVPVLAFCSFLWHKTAMPVFLERFVLSALAAAAILLIITNPMGLDTTQRVTGGLAIVFAAYFFAHTTWKHSHPDPDPDFVSIKVLATIACTAADETTFWGSYSDGEGEEVAPINCLMLMEVIAKDKPVTMESFFVEVPTSEGWKVMPRIPLEAITLYTGTRNRAFLTELDHPDIGTFLHQDLQPHRTVLGYGAFELKDPTVVQANADAIVRVVVTNSEGKTVKAEIKASAPDPDMFAEGKESLKVVNKNIKDFTNVRQKRFYNRHF